MKHERQLCYECKDVGLCDGQAADGCDFMNLVEFETTQKQRLAKLDDQFSTIDKVLKAKKEAFIRMYRKDPRISNDEAISYLLTTLEVLDLTNREEIKVQNTMQNQLTKQRKIADEAVEMNMQLQQLLEHQEEKNQMVHDANKNLEACQQDLQNQLQESEVSRRRLESEKTALDKKFNQKEEDYRRLNRLLQETQTRLQDAELVKAEQTRKIDKLERDSKDAYLNRGAPSAQKAPVGALETKQIIGNKQTIVCDRFSDDNYQVTVSKLKQGFFKSKVWSVKTNGAVYGYCFLKHPKIQKNQILKWTLRVPKSYGLIGMVIILE